MWGSILTSGFGQSTSGFGQPQQQQTGGLFGSTNTNTNTGFGGFGSNTQQQPQQQTNSFGARPTFGATGTSTFGQSNSKLIDTRCTHFNG